MLWAFMNYIFATLLFQILYFAEKVHCVWLSNGEMNVLFECKQFKGPHFLGSMPIKCIKNKEVVKEYLVQKEFIPHIKTLLTMEPTQTLKLNEGQ